MKQQVNELVDLYLQAYPANAEQREKVFALVDAAYQTGVTDGLSEAVKAIGG